MEFQDLLSKTGIQRRVDDARKAGIHPLYAIGAQTYNAPAVYTGGTNLSNSLGRAGQDLGTALTRMLDRGAQKQKDLNNRLLEAQIAESDARKELLLSKSARERQAAQQGIGVADLGVMDEVSGGKPGRTSPGIIKESRLLSKQPGFGEGLIDVRPAQQKTRKKNMPGVIAGLQEGYQTYILPGGFPIQIPGAEQGSLSEVLEAVPWYAWPGIIQYNSKFYGDPWAKEFRDFVIFGEMPKNKYVPATVKHREKRKYRFNKPGMAEDFWKTRDKVYKYLKGHFNQIGK